jgi:alkylation response protein AidB-like acyl-CoA dehydrogenase
MKIAYLNGRGHAGEHKLLGMEPFIQNAPVLPDAWAGDEVLRRALRHHLGPDLFEAASAQLSEMGELATAPATLDLSMQAESEPPRLVPYSTWGERVDIIKVSPAYEELGRLGVLRGVTALPYESTPFGEKARVVWVALMNMWGPSSALYSCPVAMTDAAARTLLLHGDEKDLIAVQHLTSRDPGSAWTSGQWMTETTGGSDVGRTATSAVRGEDGSWRLYGTKWFTSATTSEMALTLARPEGAAEGSRGLGLFRVHRNLPDGTRNRIFVRRLKDKLGTRSLPTAELELEGAIATPVGDVFDGGGLRRIATMLNLTRLHNSIGAAGSLGRGLAWAKAYAKVREVGGISLARLPAHQMTLFDLEVDYAAALALVFRCAELTGRAEHGGASENESALLRGLTPVTKLATARWAVAGAAEAMEAVGGVGYCEDSGLPALVRNAHVLPIWEGTTNVLALDLLRADERSGSIAAILDHARSLARGARLRGGVDQPADAVLATADALQARSAEERPNLDVASAGARPLALSLAATYACALLCEQATSAVMEPDARVAAMAARLAARGLEQPRARLFFDEQDVDIAAGSIGRDI